MSLSVELNPVDTDRLAAFRKAMGSVCSPVGVVTSVEDGRAHGTTVSAFCSLSISPPMVLVCLDARSNLLSVIGRTRRFGINVLSYRQRDHALRFARKGQDKFDGVAWTHENGAARLEAPSAWVSCEVRSMFPGGDHWIVQGEVVNADSTSQNPLSYHASVFGTHAPLG